MNILFPRIKLKQLPLMFIVASLGALIGGVYGIVHDSITYQISPEYFTRLKFDQFSWADLGLTPPLFAAEIGFIASGAAGFISGWFIARTAVPRLPPSLVISRSLRAFLIVFTFAITAFVIGYTLGKHFLLDYSRWISFCEALSVTDVSDFVRVAYIHYASYIGGFIGLITAVLLLRRQKTEQGAAANP